MQERVQSKESKNKILNNLTSKIQPRIKISPINQVIFFCLFFYTNLVFDDRIKKQQKSITLFK